MHFPLVGLLNRPRQYAFHNCALFLPGINYLDSNSFEISNIARSESHAV
jgi:hypothetical protein